MWNDASGDRLREWLGVNKDVFYNSGMIGVIPMDFYYPGKSKSSDLPPRKGIAEKWHPRLLNKMIDVKLIILVGSYSQKYYLNFRSSDKITDVIKITRTIFLIIFLLFIPLPEIIYGLRKINGLKKKLSQT